MKYTLSISELTDIQIVKASPILFLTTQEQHKFLNHTTGIMMLVQEVQKNSISIVVMEVLIHNVHNVLESYFCHCNCNHTLFCLNDCQKKKSVIYLIIIIFNN